jgi:hypothetical protein
MTRRDRPWRHHDDEDGGFDIAPVTLGAGERLFDGVPPLRLELLAVRAASLTTHISYRVLH